MIARYCCSLERIRRETSDSTRKSKYLLFDIDVTVDVVFEDQGGLEVRLHDGF